MNLAQKRKIAIATWKKSSITYIFDNVMKRNGR